MSPGRPDPILLSIVYDPGTPDAVIAEVQAMMDHFIHQHWPPDSAADQVLALEEFSQRVAALEHSGVHVTWSAMRPAADGSGQP